jgi:hypothetical protein
MGDLLFGTLEYQTTIPPKRLMMALCLHMIGFILPKGNTQVYNLPRSLEAMQALLLDAAIPKDILAVALIAHGPTTDPDTYTTTSAALTSPATITMTTSSQEKTH